MNIENIGLFKNTVVVTKKGHFLLNHQKNNFCPAFQFFLTNVKPLL
jgi:hypothetical protein